MTDRAGSDRDEPIYDVAGSEVVYDGHLSRVRVDQVRMPDGEVTPREVVEHPDAVAIVPLDEDGTVVLLRQYRPALGRWALELPAGILDVEGESPEAAAHRELQEETGFVANSLERLVTFQNSGGWTDEETTIFLGRGLHRADVPEGFTASAEEADMDVLRLPLEEALQAARHGEITDAKTLIGLLLVADLVPR